MLKAISWTLANLPILIVLLILLTSFTYSFYSKKSRPTSAFKWLTSSANFRYISFFNIHILFTIPTFVIWRFTNSIINYKGLRTKTTPIFLIIYEPSVTKTITLFIFISSLSTSNTVILIRPIACVTIRMTFLTNGILKILIVIITNWA